MNNPYQYDCCIGCKPPKRNPHCHSTCGEYLQKKAENDKKKKEIKEQARLDTYRSDMLFKIRK